MRLIDADELYQEAENRSEKMNGYFNELSRVITAWDINHAPTIDAIHVVRCGECVHYNELECAHIFSTLSDDDFCSYGERRADNV